jgi:hypothetical protein
MNPNGEQEIESNPTPEKTPQVDLNEKFPLQTQEYSNGNLTFRDLVPEQLREGGETPIVMMAGWAMNTDKVVGGTTRGLYDKGQRVIALDLEGGAKGITGRFSNEIERQGEVVYEWLKSRPDQKFKFAPQSMAALTILSMVQNHPEITEQIAGLVELSPMGHAGPPGKHTMEASMPMGRVDEKDGKVVFEPTERSDNAVMSTDKNFRERVVESVKGKLPFKNLRNLASRKFVEDARNASRPKTAEDDLIGKRVMDSFWDSILHHPIKSLREIVEMAGADQYNILNLLKSKGVKVGIIQGAQDRLNSYQGLSDNIARQAVANSSLEAEYIDENGMHKIPDSLRIDKEHDSPEEISRKQSEIMRLMLHFQQAEKKVPVDGLVVVEGGHEITGPYDFSNDILHTFDTLEHQLTPEEVTVEAQRKRFYEDQDRQAIEKARKELYQIEE